MTEPGEFKFECKEHDNCKRYFKSEKRLKEHLKKYGGKNYPANLARQYVPNLPENHSTIVDSRNIQITEKMQSKIEKQKVIVKKVNSLDQEDDHSKPLKKRAKKDTVEVVDATEEIILKETEYQPPPFQQFYQHLYNPGNLMTQQMYRHFQEESSSSSQQNYWNYYDFAFLLLKFKRQYTSDL